jgi:hypothetical protein
MSLKDAPKRSGKYLRWVASLPCAHCGRIGYSQAAHANEGKGLSMKTGDNTAMPLCAESLGRLGCHSMLDRGAFSREHRRMLERTYYARTRSLAIDAGQWPEGWE